MKKTTTILILMLILALSLSFMACNDDNTDHDIKSVTLYIVDSDNNELAKYEEQVELNSLYDFLESIKNQENSTFDYTVEYEQYLSTITVDIDEQNQPKGLFPKQNEFCALYHNIDDVKYRDYTSDNLTYAGKEYYFSALGIKDLPLINNAVYLVTVSAFN